MRRSGELMSPVADQRYTEVTVRLWGRGVVARGEVEGIQVVGQKRFVARAGQFIASRIDARNGALGVVPGSLEGAIVTNDFPLFDIDSARLDPRFLGWLSRTNGFVHLCRRASEGTTNRVRLKEERFLALEIRLPSVAEQRRIVARIEAIAGKVEEAKRLRGEAKDEETAFIVSLHCKLSGKRMRALGDVLQLDEDSVPVLSAGSYPQVGVRSFGSGLFRKGPVQGTETTYRSFNRLYFGAVLLSQVKGWEGAVAICPPELDGWYVSPEYRTFRCIESETIPEYLQALLPTEWFWGRLGSATRGVGARRERTRPEQFLRVSIPMPTVIDQIWAARTFQKLQSVQDQRHTMDGQLNALLPAVLDHAFRREL